MAFNNTVNYAAVFNRILDEKFYILPRTMWMENTNPGIEWNGGKEIKIPYVGMNGLGTMNGYKAPDGDLTLGWETKQLQWYRGRNFAIGRYDVDETNMALTVGNALRVFLAEQLTGIREKYEEYFTPKQEPEQPKNTPQFAQQPGRSGINPTSEEDKLFKQLSDSWK